MFVSIRREIEKVWRRAWRDAAAMWEQLTRVVSGIDGLIQRTTSLPAQEHP